MSTRIDRLVSILAEEIKIICETAEMLPNGKVPPDQRAFFAVLAHLANEHLDRHPDWPAGGWVDAILSDSLQFETPNSLRATGRLIWGKRPSSAQWIEPFTVRIQFSLDTQSLGCPDFYVICVGDAGRGLGQVAYGRPIRRMPSAWMFEFKYPEAGRSPE